MTAEQELKKDTKQLKEFISQVDNSGIAAWNAGDLLKIVKDKKGYVSQFSTFNNYTRTEVGISPQTANNYITIRESFTIEEIGELMLITHLRVIAEIQNDKTRKLVLECFREKDEQYQKQKKRGQTKGNDDVSQKDIYKPTLADVIGVVTIVAAHGTELSKEEIEEVISINIEKSKEQSRQSKRAKRQAKGTNEKDFFGNPLKAKFFKQISDLFGYEPIDEMGLVALFCVMFQFLRQLPFEWKGDNIEFNTIKYVREKFPDASILCQQVKKRKTKERNFELDVEFEYESYNYITHNHMQSDKNCDLIICWVDNAKTDKRLNQMEAIKNMPPVLSLKNCFETGKIEIIH
ncbi:hypothetical protein [Bernardetia sp. MNP-M8]|uniref:hypothetical protein n=1 Tax=Bernardetia sp. MNP-M8 TaxID=3127470 RepID=UPI0030D2D03D